MIAIALFVTFDILVTSTVLVVVLRRRRALAGLDGAGLDPGKVADIRREVESRTREYLQANWSGDPSTLPVALTSLLDSLDADLRERGTPIERMQLRIMVGRVIEAGGMAKGHDVREAMRLVA